MVTQGGGSVPDRVRAACAVVAAQARSVKIDESAIAAYASGLPAAAELSPPDPATHFAEGDREVRVAFVVCLDGVLRLDPVLEARIDAGELLAHGGGEEVELRACAVHAIELLSAPDPLECFIAS